MLARRAVLGGLIAAYALATNPAGNIRLEDTAVKAGLAFVLRNDAAGRKYQVETLVGGLAVIDFDNDGWRDIYAVNGAALPSLEKNSARFHNRLYRNSKNGTFTDVTESAGVAGRGYSIGVAVGDFNNDGWDDIYIAGVNESVLYFNSGNGTFTDVTKVAGVEGREASGKKLLAIAAAWIDYDQDGLLDLFVSNYCDWSPGLDPVCGGIEERSRTCCSPNSYRGQSSLLYHNNGNDYSHNPPAAAGKKVVIADADHIGWTSTDPQFAWKNFLRGNNPVIFD